MEERLVTMPKLLSKDKTGAGLPVTVKDKVAAWPAMILEGEAIKEVMVGAVEVETGGGLFMGETVMVTDLVAVPPNPVAVKV